jgi:hypothetical protein
MDTIYRPEDAPAVYGADSRAVEVVTDAAILLSTGAPFQSNSAKVGDIWEFNDLNTLLTNGWIRRQLTRAGGSNKTTLICGERTRDGKTQLAWFNLGSLIREDYDGNPVMPEWHALGNDNLKIEKLHKMGKFEVTDTKTVKVQKWDGAVRLDGQTTTQDYAIIPWK